MRVSRERIARALWRERVEQLRQHWRWTLGFVSFFAALGFLFGSPVHTVAKVRGEVIGEHQQQTETGRGRREVSVRLEDGRIVSAALPSGYMARPRYVELYVLQRSWWPKFTTYRYAGGSSEESP